jgi:hypothetical protein
MGLGAEFMTHYIFQTSWRLHTPFNYSLCGKIIIKVFLNSKLLQSLKENYTRRTSLLHINQQKQNQVQHKLLANLFNLLMRLCAEMQGENALSPLCLETATELKATQLTHLIL